MATREELELIFKAVDQSSQTIAAISKSLDKFELAIKAVSDTFSALAAVSGDAVDGPLADMRGRLDDATRALNTLAKSSEEARARLGGVEDQAEKTGASGKTNLSNIGNALTALGAATSELEKIPLIGSGVSQLGSAFASAGGVASAAGVAVNVAWAPIVLVLGAVVAAIGGVAAAFVAAGNAAANAVQTAVNWGTTIDDMQDVTGVSAEFGSTLATGARIAGMDVNQLTDNLTVLSRKLSNTGDDGEDAMAKLAGASAKAGDQLAQLADDHIRAVTDAEQSLARTVGDASQALTRSLEAARKQNETASAAYYQRLNDLAESHAQTVINLQQSISDAQADTQDQQQQRQERLNEDLAKVDESAAADRAGILSQYANANTDLGKAARDSELAALDQRTQKEKEKLTTAAKAEEDRQKAADDKKLARLREQLAREDTEYSKQTERLSAENRQREQDYRESVARMTSDAAVSLSRAQADSAKSMQDMQQQYLRQIDAIAASTAAAAANIGKATDATSKAFEDLGINIEEFDKLSPNEKILALFDALLKVPEGFERSSAAQALFGRNAGAMLDLLDIYKVEGWEGLKKKAQEYGLYLSQDQVDADKKFQQSVNETKLRLAALEMKIGTDLLPVFQKLLDEFEEFWEKHGPEVIKVVDQLATILVPALTTGIGDAAQAIDDLLTSVQRDPFGTLGRAALDLIGVGGPLRLVIEALTGIKQILDFKNYQGRMNSLGIITTTYAQGGTNNYNYSPTYSSSPTNPSMDFAMMEALSR